jgi:phage tail-like protein
MSKFDRYDDFSATSATFDVVVDGQTLGRFLEASGLEVEVEVFEVTEGGQNFFKHKFPGRFSFPNLTLKRGVTADNGLVAWLDKSSAGAFEAAGNKLKRTTVALVLTTATGDALRTWTFYDAFPVKWSGPSFTANSDDFLVEELEIAHHGFSIKDDSPAVKKAATGAAKQVAKKATGR